MQAFKKVMSVILVVSIISSITLIFSMSAGAVQNEPSVSENNLNGQQNSDEVYYDGWVYKSHTTKDRDLAATGTDIEIPDEKVNEIEINLKGINASGEKEAMPGATVNLYVGSELRSSVVDTDNDGVVKLSLEDLTEDEYYKATVSAYKKTAEGKAIDGNDRDSVYKHFKNKAGDIIRYEYELHSETIDDNGNWVGKELVNGKKADIVFAIDATGSMSDEIWSVKENIASFSETLIESGVDIRFSIIEYRDITCGEETIIHTFSGSKWTSSLSDVTDTLAGIYATGGGDNPETPIDALGATTQDSMNWRSDAQKYAFLFTDAESKTNNTYGYTSLSELAGALKSKNICTSVICPTYYYSDYSSLYTSTEGISANIYSSFYDSMQSLAENILIVSKRKIELTLTEPRIKYNLTVCYFANDAESSSAAYKNDMQRMLTEYAKDIAQTSDGHVFINKIHLFSTNNRMSFFNKNSDASKADIQIQTKEKDRGSGKNLVQIHSNAYVGGYYKDGRVSSNESVDAFTNLKNADSYNNKNCYRRIQMSAVEGAGWNNSFSKNTEQYATTLTHESGHYIFGFYDEYGYIDNDGEFTSWGKVKRPNGVMFGLMDNQHEDIEMSKLSIDYKDLDCLTNKTNTNSPAQYYNHNNSCEGYLADILTGKVTDFDLDLGKYQAVYSKVNTDYDRTASYSWPDVRFVKDSKEIAYTGAGEFDSMTLSKDKISDTDYYVSDGKIHFTLTPISGHTYSAYYMDSADVHYTEVSSVKDKSGKLTFSFDIPEEDTIEIRLAEDSQYVSYYVDSSSSTNVGYLYESADGTTLAYENVTTDTDLIHVSDNTSVEQGNYVSVNSSTYITAGDPASISGGEIYSVASCYDDIDYSTLSWFVYRDGKWTKLGTDTSYEENNNIGARADITGYGLYVLMAKKASSASVKPAEELSFTTDNTKDGRILLNFKDSNEDSEFYRVYRSEEAFESIDNENVIGQTFNAADGSSLALNLYQPDESYYLAVEIVTKTGAKSDLSFISVTGKEADKDGDGIPDSYCDKYLLWGKDGEEKDIAGSDDDSDGLTNLEEYLGGSDPTNPNDPVVTIPVPVKDVTVSFSERTIRKGDSFILTADIIPKNATNKSVTWSTDNDSVLELTPSDMTCRITGLASGTTNVYAVSGDGGYSASCKVIVSETLDTFTISGNVASYLSTEDPVTVELISSDDTVVSSDTITEENPFYIFSGLEKGDYTLRASKKDHTTRDYSVTFSEDDISLDISINPYGDVNGDGKTNVQDCTAILRNVRKLDTKLSDYQLKCTDVTGDGKTNVQDVTRILRHVRKIETLY